MTAEYEKSIVHPVSGGGGGFMIFCPGCQCGHRFQVEGTPRWDFNGDMEGPTFSPSYLVQWDAGHPPVHHQCHSFVRDGQIQFLSDCTHALAGQTVPLEPF